MKRLKQFQMAKKIKRFQNEEDGATALEFAIVGGPFFLLIFAIIESALFFFASQYLETTVDEVTRLFRTGQLDASTTEGEFRKEFCDRLIVLFTCAEISTDIKVAAEFAALGDPAKPDAAGNLPANSYTAPGPLQIIQVSAQAKWPVYTNFAAPLLHSEGGNFALIQAIAVTRTEPYS